MVPRLTDLPVEIIARAAEFLPELSQLLALRSSAGSCKQAVVRAVKHHHACKRWRPRPTMPQNAATVAIGRVFGAGCRILDIPSHAEPVSAVATGLEPFLMSTGGLLTELYDDHNAITPDHLLILCRACPVLKRLCVKSVPNIQPADFVAVSQLRSVSVARISRASDDRGPESGRDLCEALSSPQRTQIHEGVEGQSNAYSLRHDRGSGGDLRACNGNCVPTGCQRDA